MNNENFKGSLKDAYYKDKTLDPDDRDDKLLMRARKPIYKKIDKSLSLNFGGRVKKASRKNVQIVTFLMLMFRNTNLKGMIKSELYFSMESYQMIYSFWISVTLLLLSKHLHSP